MLLFIAVTYGGRGRLYDGPQDVGGHRRAARCVTLQPLRRGAIKELRTAMALLDAACSTRRLLRLIEDRAWMASHGPETPWFNFACTLIFCVCEPRRRLGVNYVSVPAETE